MKLLTTKIYRARNADDSHRVYGIAKRAANLYNKQRYNAPGVDQSDRWAHVQLGAYTNLYHFHQSDIVIVECQSPAPCCEQTSIDQLAADQEAEMDRLLEQQEVSYKPLWAAQWLILTESERREKAQVAQYWLKDTARPDDAKAIVAGSMDVSMTWLRYLAVETPDLAARLKEMRIAQFYYAEFDQMNADLLLLISDLSHCKTKSIAQLSSLESVYEMKQIQLQEDLRVQPRAMKRSIETILAHWEFERLQRSVSKLQTLYASMVDKRLEQRASVSRLVTEGILLLIGLLAFFDLIISWSLLGRQLVANPILLVDELELPFTARIVANVPMDTLMFTVSSMALLLLVIYVLFRRAFR